MSDLGVLLQRLRYPLPPAAHVRYRVWCDHELAAAARDANGEELVGVRRIGPPVDARSEILVSIWRCAPDRVRVEHEGGVQDGAIGIRVGERWWSRSPRHGERSSDEYPPGASWLGQGAETFLDPPSVLDGMRFEPTGYGTRAGRPVLIADAWRSREAGRQPLLSGLGAHADRCRVEVDAERGHVLSHQCFFRGAPYETIDVIDLQLDGPLDMNLFAFPGTAEADRLP